MNNESADRLKRNASEIARAIKDNTNQDVDTLRDVLEERGYLVGGAEPLRVYGNEYADDGNLLTPFVESEGSAQTSGVEVEHKYAPSYSIDDLLKAGNLPLTEALRIERIFDFKELVFKVSGLYLSIEDNTIILTKDLKLDRFDKDYHRFKRGVEKAKRYLDNVYSEKKCA